MSVFILEQNLFGSEKKMKSKTKGKLKRKTRSKIRVIWGRKKGLFLWKGDEVRTRSVSCGLDLSYERTRSPLRNQKNVCSVAYIQRGGWVLW